uniref:Uncharacterized protein n=1 Tax=Romanomermis culicivorax TaxID=13658 RepID=A0A915K1D8_ROMCU
MYRNELERILRDTKLSPEQQYKMYSQLFSQYFNLEQGNTKPQTVISKAAQETNGDVKNKDYTDQVSLASDREETSHKRLNENLLNGLPKRKRPNAALSIEHILKNPIIDLNNDGEVVIDKMCIPGSHILDLVQDFSRKCIKGTPPKGVVPFAKALKRYNVPKESIRNPSRWAIINKTTDLVHPVDKLVDFELLKSVGEDDDGLYSSVKRKIRLDNDAENSVQYFDATPKLKTHSTQKKKAHRTLLRYSPLYPQMDHLLSTLYESFDSSATLGSIQKLYSEAKKHDPRISLKDVKSWLSTKDS